MTVKEKIEKLIEDYQTYIDYYDKQYEYQTTLVGQYEKEYIETGNITAYKFREKAKEQKEVFKRKSLEANIFINHLKEAITN